MILALENSLPRVEGRFGSRAEHLEAFIRELEHPRFGLCLDTGHAQVAGGQGGAVRLFDVMRPRLTAFHMQDNAGDRDSHLAPGRGSVDWGGIFRRLAAMDFDGPVCIEAPPFAPGPLYETEAWRKLVKDTDELVAEALKEG
jgi:sugar phosphate isomerase/epimerase